jgi:hypothetical protein
MARGGIADMLGARQSKRGDTVKQNKKTGVQKTNECQPSTPAANRQSQTHEARSSKRKASDVAKQRITRSVNGTVYSSELEEMQKQPRFAGTYCLL